MSDEKPAVDDQWERVCAVAMAIADFALASGISNINRIPGTHKARVDDQWEIEVNGHRETVNGIPPFHMAVLFHGWPAGIFHPVEGGLFAAGDAANEDSFLMAIRTRTITLGGTDSLAAALAHPPEPTREGEC